MCFWCWSIGSVHHVWTDAMGVPTDALMTARSLQQFLVADNGPLNPEFDADKRDALSTFLGISLDPCVDREMIARRKCEVLKLLPRTNDDGPLGWTITTPVRYGT